ncbi:sugar phosphate isomerase/epimerase [Nocardioides sp.]|uniref:sugar phosphate isomerase/epimerase family protein n=1 Tax=Nocardioides sp. TaxID=35761 RepID=UPI002733C866|nr:sugar phosphate isomerase/epimerase family protein [Nocardioides sp.]MDP3890723.1 sugar phosphate isomerase/epimerase family protein [Nocardioides sp.]
MSALRWGYGLNGFTGHRLGDACAVVAGLGYQGVGLTLDQPHLDPFAEDVAAQVAHARACLDRQALACVIETGSRYVLDPWHKHEPTLVSGSRRERRVELLTRAVRIAHELGAEAMSCWSGTLPSGVPDEEGWRRLLGGLGPVLDTAARLGVVVAFEPEPGMFVATLDDALELRRRLGEPEHLRLTLDLGHLVCNEPRTPAETVAIAGPLLGNVQVDDMVRDVHEHLPLGTGALDLDAVVAALVGTGYTGLASVELPRHSHAAPVVAAQSMAALTDSLDRVLAANHPEEVHR